MEISRVRKRLSRIYVNKIARTVVAFCIMQIIVTIVSLPTIFINFESGIEFLLACVSILVSVVSIQSTALLVRAYRSQFQAQQMIAELESLILKLRAERHDFKNHIQVISGLIDMKEYADVKDYLMKVDKDLRNISRTFRTSQPAINALLQAKSNLCKSKNIAFNLEITTKLEKLSIESWEICRVLGNLIDNAVEALAQTKVPLPTIVVGIRTHNNGYIFWVSNNGAPVSRQNRSKIFKPEFSTKGEGRGMGLAIVSDIINRNGGKIELISTDKETRFSIWIPNNDAKK